MTMSFTLFDLHPGSETPELRFEFNAPLEEGDMREMVQTVLDHGPEAHLLVELDGFPQVRAGAMKAKAEQMGALLKLRGRYAVVTDTAWMRTAAPLADALTPLQVRAFDRSHLSDARDWVRAA